MGNDGWVKLHRSMLDWEWYKDVNTRSLFVHLLLKANHDPGNWQGIKVDRGQFITGLHALSEETGLSVRNVRTSLNHLISTGEVTRIVTSKYSVINVINYAKYQGSLSDGDNQTDSLADKQPTSNRQASDKQPTTNKNNKKNKNNKNNNYTGLFEQFWKSYPRKVAKAEARRIWTDKLKPDEELFSKIMKSLEAIKHTEWVDKETQYIPHARTWLNQRRWEDDDLPSQPENNDFPSSNASITDDEYERMKQEHEARLRGKHRGNE